MSTAIPSGVVRDSVELTRLLAEPTGRRFLELMEQEVLDRIGRMLSLHATDEEVLGHRQVILALTGMVDNGLLNHVRLAQGWMANHTTKELTR